MIDSVFKAHPRTVGETYLEHLGAAASFGLLLIRAGIACLVHALLPALFTDTASRAVDDLHTRMVLKRRRRAMSAGADAAAGPRA